jgi:hypothetical protein
MKMNLKSKLIAAVMIILGITAFMSSCTKEMDFVSDGAMNHPLKSVQVSDYSLDNIPILENKQNIEKLLLNPEDRDDEKINNYLYELSLAIRELIKDANFNSIVIELAKKSENQTANLLELEKIAPEYYRAINSKLSGKGLSLSSISGDLTHKPVTINSKFPETSEIEKYVSSIFIPNLSIIDIKKQPIISPNIEVDCRNNESIEDNIIAWYYTKDGDLKEILLSEETSLKTTNPLFLLDNTSPNMKKNTVKILPPEQNKTTTSFSSHEYKINYAYESWAGGKSEFCIVAYRITPSGEVHWIYSSSGWKEIAKVKKDDIGKSLTKWTKHSGNYTPYGQNYVFWNTYERDWNRSKKLLGDPTANGLHIYMYGRRKYESEWYAWIPSTVQIHNTDLNYIYWHWARWYNSWKSDYRIWRVEL